MMHRGKFLVINYGFALHNAIQCVQIRIRRISLVV